MIDKFDEMVDFVYVNVYMMMNFLFRNIIGF